ncbi:glycosyltransferase involved in cell wall biosynthesis [Flavobacterium sp. PL11]|uniref:glycosyltransferase n=1 Tax=Flavobacterium sp. PL11 TaxID=3071717 RepID=UPI002E005BED|nr:glycosyltransferase involved in cell wall biosynthesis [Flavobacterium sp. PL11]
MNIIIFTHPKFLAHQSMPRFAQMLKEGMKQKGHQIIEWSPRPFFIKLAFLSKKLSKWLGYLDQYFVFPIEVSLKLIAYKKETLFVFADNALGPWVTLVKNRQHVVHCHDFLAQHSAFDLIPENKISQNGKYYQKFILWGYRKAENFISISYKTQSDLHVLLETVPKVSHVVYNGLNQNFVPTQNKIALRKILSTEYNIDLSAGFVLHVGGNAFYKNKLGVLEIYDYWSSHYSVTIPLILVGEYPETEIIAFKEKSSVSKSIHFIANTEDLRLQQFYQSASVLLFPSLYEGFGWPIIEAMASGCLVITTEKDPMKEVAGEAGFYIPKKPFDEAGIVNWKKIAAQELQKVIHLSPEDHCKAVEISLSQSKKFLTIDFMNAIEKIYFEILKDK